MLKLYENDCSIRSLWSFKYRSIGMRPENERSHSLCHYELSVINSPFKNLVKEKYPFAWHSILYGIPKCDLHRDIIKFEDFIDKKNFPHANRMIKRLMNYKGHYFNYKPYEDQETLKDDKHKTHEKDKTKKIRKKEKR